MTISDDTTADKRPVVEYSIRNCYDMNVTVWFKESVSLKPKFTSKLDIVCDLKQRILGAAH